MTDEEIINELRQAWLCHPDTSERSFCAVLSRAREILSKPVATREGLAIFLRSRGNWTIRDPETSLNITDILAAFTHFSPPAHSLDRLCDGALRRSAKIVDPPPPEGLPSAAAISGMICDEAERQKYAWDAGTVNIARTIARDLLEKHARQKMMIDGMTADKIEDAIWTDGPTSAAVYTSRSAIAHAIYHLATTPAPAAPKVDQDAGAKRIFSILHYSGELPWTWENILDETRDACRTLARHVEAKQVKP